jgi:hypothetical protein
MGTLTLPVAHRAERIPTLMQSKTVGLRLSRGSLPRAQDRSDFGNASSPEADLFHLNDNGGSGESEAAFAPLHRTMENLCDAP